MHVHEWRWLFAQLFPSLLSVSLARFRMLEFDHKNTVWSFLFDYSNESKFLANPDRGVTRLNRPNRIPRQLMTTEERLNQLE